MNESAAKKKKEKKELASLLLKTLEDILYNRLNRRKANIQSQNRSLTDKLRTGIEILHGIITQES